MGLFVGLQQLSPVLINAFVIVNLVLRRFIKRHSQFKNKPQGFRPTSRLCCRVGSVCINGGPFKRGREISANKLFADSVVLINTDYPSSR